jgi:hypothetical protein
MCAPLERGRANLTAAHCSGCTSECGGSSERCGMGCGGKGGEKGRRTRLAWWVGDGWVSFVERACLWVDAWTVGAADETKEMMQKVIQQANPKPYPNPNPNLNPNLRQMRPRR